ncbi:MAG: Response regulator PleD [Gammaproteobacteria bacterium]|nr:Response regulator PleD [Gammaproteobacteria bacterium]
MQHVRRLDSNQPRIDPEVRSRILIVDDVATNRFVLRSLLSKPDHQVLEAEDGEQALECIDRTPLDLVVLDILMPGISGLEVLQKIRKSYSDSELPVLMLSVNDSIDDVVKALETGANDYVTRPFDYTVLTTRINNLIAYKQTQDTIRESHATLENRIAERTNDLVQANRILRNEVIERKTGRRASQDKPGTVSHAV